MKKAFLSIALVLFAAGIAQAGVLNDTTSFKGFVDSLEPSYSWAYDVENKTNQAYTSVSLVSYNKADLGLGSLRVGYLGDNPIAPDAAGASLELMIPNIVATYIPAQFKGIKANLAALSVLPSVGIFGSYDFEGKDWGWGPSLGAKFMF